MRALPRWVVATAIGFAAVILLLTFGPLLFATCSHNSLCFEFAKGMPTALVALVVAGVASYIAWRQYLATHAKLKLDLFERRYAIFEETWRELTILHLQGAKSITSAFSNSIPKAGFLFGAEIESYLSEIAKKRTELWALEQRAQANSGVIANADLENDKALQAWLHAELNEDRAKSRFAPFLGFENWR